MGLRRFDLVVVALLIPAGARASDHKAAMFVAASDAKGPGSSINVGGVHLAWDWALENHHKISFVGDLSVHFIGGEKSSGEGAAIDPAQRDVTQFTFAFGPRWTPYGKAGTHNRPFMPFGHVLVGVVDRAGGSHLAATAFALVPGFGWDLAPGEHKTWGLRAQVDYIWPVSSDMRHSWRFSLGAIYRFHR
jgi:hypothetical protein